MRVLGIFAVPYGIYGIYLLITGSAVDYLLQGWKFNQLYYVYNYPRPEGSTTINPMRFAIVIANSFYNNFFALLQQLPNLNVNYPVNITMALGSIGAIFYTLWKKQYAFGLFLIGIITYANARSNPLDSRETDYQSAVYIIIAFILIPFLLVRLKKELDEGSSSQKFFACILLVLVGFYSFYSGFFLVQKFSTGPMTSIWAKPRLFMIAQK